MPIRSHLQHAAVAIAASLFFTLPVHASERTLDSAYGPLTLSGTPQSVVALGDSALDAALSLGVQPLGTLASRGGDDIPDYLKAKAGKIALVGSVREPNLEAILRLQPDLVLASADLSRELYAKLSLMAPTVVPKGSSFQDWRASYTAYAQALDKAEQGQQRIAEIDARSAQLRQRLPQGQTVSVVRWNPQGPVIMSSHLFVGQLLNDLGLRANELAAAQSQKPHSDVLSLENLSRINADWIFLATLNPDGRKALEDARKQPAFTRLPAVADGHVATVDGQIWSSSSGYLAVMAGIVSGAEIVLIPERTVTLEEIAKAVESAYLRGKTHAFIINAEGSGHKTDELAKSLEDMDVGFQTRVTILGHIQRGGSPTAYDRLLASRMGVKAVDALMAGMSGVMTGLQGRGIDYIPLEEVIAGKREVNMEYYEMVGLLAR